MNEEKMSKKILLVESDKETSDLLSAELSKEGYEVDKSSSVNESLEKIVSQDYILIIADTKVDDGNGIEILKKSFETEKNKNKITGRIVVTAGESDTIIEATKYDLSAFLIKTKEMDFEKIIRDIKRAEENTKRKRQDLESMGRKEVSGFEKSFYLKNTRLPVIIHDRSISENDVSIYSRETDRGLRRLNSRINLIEAVEKDNDVSYAIACAKVFFKEKKYSSGITGKEKKSLDDRIKKEGFLMRYANRRWAPCVDLSYEMENELIMRYYTEPSDDLEMKMFNDNIKNKERISYFINEKKKSIELSDKNIADFNAVMTYFSNDYVEYGPDSAKNRETKKVRDVVEKERKNREGNFDLFAYHQDRIKKSLTGRIIYNYYDIKAKKASTKYDKYEESQREWFYHQFFGSDLNPAKIEKECKLEEIICSKVNELFSPVLDCYKNLRFLGIIHDDMANTEHIGRTTDIDKEDPTKTIEFKVIYDMDKCAFDKEFTDILNYIADHINNASIEESVTRMENYVVNNYNKKAKLIDKLKMPYPLNEGIEYKSQIKNISELPQDYASNYMKQMQLVMIEVLLHYSSLGCWNQINNFSGYKDLISRVTRRDFNKFNIKGYDICYDEIINNKVILQTQDKKIEAWLDYLITNNNVHKLDDETKNKVKEIKQFLYEGLPLYDLNVPVIEKRC
jgi:CheY-like chemotaxis protein